MGQVLLRFALALAITAAAPLAAAAEARLPDEQLWRVALGDRVEIAVLVGRSGRKQPKAAIILLPGGDGRLRLHTSERPGRLKNNFLFRTRHALRRAGNNRDRTGACSAAHASSQKDHMAALDLGANVFNGFFGGLTTNFRPCAGPVQKFRPPGGFGVRVDTHMHEGGKVSPYYDSLVAKIIVHQPTRIEAIRCMQRCLKEFTIEPIHTTIPFLRRVLSHPDFLEAKIDTGFVDRAFQNRHRKK